MNVKKIYIYYIITEVQIKKKLKANTAFLFPPQVLAKFHSLIGDSCLSRYITAALWHLTDSWAHKGMGMLRDSILSLGLNIILC